MRESVAQKWGMNARRLRGLAGLAAAIVPCAMIVHVLAEAAATWHDGLDLNFVVRHSYFGALLALSAWWFGATVGLGRPAAERRRRCALLRSHLAGSRRPQSLLVLAGANLAFFGLTQAAEGAPLADGSVTLGLGVALAGSLLAALLVFFFGRSIAAAGLECAIGQAPQPCPVLPPAGTRPRTFAAPRRATDAFTLFVPNRPPPAATRS